MFGAGNVSISVPKNSIFTLTTTTGQRKGAAPSGAAVIPPARNFSSFLPLRYDFEGAAVDSLPRFWSDMQGAFAVAKQSGAATVTGDGVSANQVMRQNAPVPTPYNTLMCVQNV